MCPPRLCLRATVALLLGATSLHAIIDRNGDGLSDVWAALYHPTKGATVDEDGDGFTNAQEALAGTDPLDPASCFAAVLRADATGALVLRWHGLRGKRYTIESSSDLITWAPIPGAVYDPAATPVHYRETMATASGSRRFLRLVLRQP